MGADLRGSGTVPHGRAAEGRRACLRRGGPAVQGRPSGFSLSRPHGCRRVVPRILRRAPVRGGHRHLHPGGPGGERRRPQGFYLFLHPGQLQPGYDVPGRPGYRPPAGHPRRVHHPARRGLGGDGLPQKRTAAGDCTGKRGGGLPGCLRPGGAGLHLRQSEEQPPDEGRRPGRPRPPHGRASRQDDLRHGARGKP